jgi:hypothetical protein
MVDGYTKVVLTVIAVALVWLAAQQAITPARAAKGGAQAVFVAQISNDAARCLAGHMTWFHGTTGPCIAAW